VARIGVEAFHRSALFSALERHNCSALQSITEEPLQLATISRLWTILGSSVAPPRLETGGARRSMTPTPNFAS
jgi:hypothetical protein